MEKSNHSKPFLDLGIRLRSIRERKAESLAEASGAVEIDQEDLIAYEQGLECPDEELLMLLIDHFGLQDKAADDLWDLAGFVDDEHDCGVHIHAPTNIFMAATEPKTIYSDTVHVITNNFGVVMNFMQTSNPSEPPIGISKIGMSREHAQAVLELLQKALTKPTPKLLPNVTPKP